MIFGVGFEPFQAVKFEQRRRLGVLDPQGEFIGTLDHIKIQGANRHVRIEFIFILIRAKKLLLCGRSVNLQASGKAFRRRRKRHSVIFQLQNRDMCGSGLGKMNLVILGRTNGSFAGSEPFQADQG